MRIFLLGLVALLATPARAFDQTFTFDTTTTLSMGDGALYGTFTRSYQFTFNRYVNIHVQVFNLGATGDNVKGDVDFSSVTFDGLPFHQTQVESQANGWNDIFELDPIGYDPGAYTMLVSGFSYGDAPNLYAGVQTIFWAVDPLAPPPPVPEPATWLSMIAGFGVVGAIIRRRRETTALLV